MGTSSSSPSPLLVIKQRSRAALYLNQLNNQCNKYTYYEFDHSYIYLLSEKIRHGLNDASKSITTPKQEENYKQLLKQFEALKSKYGLIRGEEL